MSQIWASLSSVITTLKSEDEAKPKRKRLFISLVATLKGFILFFCPISRERYSREVSDSIPTMKLSIPTPEF